MGQVELVQRAATPTVWKAKNAIETEHVTKVFSEPHHREVFVDISLQIEQGEFVAALGPVGSGKTTLINLISGLDRPSSGSIYINGIETTRLSENALASIRAAKLGIVPQVQNLLDELTVYENVELPLLFLKLNGESRASRVAQVLDRMGISSEADREVSGLSVGEKQMVAIARALAPDSSIILMDEPTESLDPLISEVILELLRGDNLTKGKTIFVATHDRKIINLASRTIRVKKKIP